MREDMFKVIVERPRLGRKYAAKTKLRYDKQPGRKHVSGKRMALEHAGCTKCLNENLAPLKRYLHKQVGRPWNKVYSEISQHLDTGSTVKQHVRDHLSDFIMVNVSVSEDGAFFSARGWGGPSSPDRWWAELYVDPNDGLIKRTDKLCRKLGQRSLREKYREDRKRRALGWRYDHNLRELNETRFLVKLNGCWFQLDTDYRPIDKAQRRLNGRDLVEAFRRQNGDHSWRVLAKRQLGRKELRAHKLRNE